MTSYEKESENKTIEDLPDEILEYILSLVSPYKDSDSCKIVSKRWLRTINNVIQHSKCDLYRSIMNSNVLWHRLIPSNLGSNNSSISRRYSHAACYCDSLMYVFGGCTSRCTTFNDLWTFDLSCREWTRPFSTGCYPSPKACATICCYKKCLVLFGGWTHPPPYPLHQTLKLFNELHIYDINSNKWSVINPTSVTPPPMSGHSATIHGNYMVVFGGLQKADSAFIAGLGFYSSSNDVWCFDLTNHVWFKPETSNPKPTPRYGQSQILIDNENIMILGGCEGPNSILDDIWLLHITKSVWIWKQIKVINSHWSAPHMWCHPACRVGNAVVVFSRSAPQVASDYSDDNLGNASHDDSIPAEVIARQASQRPPIISKDNNVNGQQGSLARNNHNIDEPSTSSSEASDNRIPSPESSYSRDLFVDRNRDPRSHCTSPILNSDIQMAAFRDEEPCGKRSHSKNRMKQLESLKRMEARYKIQPKEDNPKPKKKYDPPDPNSNPSGNGGKRMHMYVADISEVLSLEGCVTWRPPRSNSGAPRDTVLHSLVLGKGEIIVFGGVQNTSKGLAFPEPNNKSVSNTLHFVTAPRTVV